MVVSTEGIVAESHFSYPNDQSKQAKDASLGRYLLLFNHFNYMFIQSMHSLSLPPPLPISCQYPSAIPLNAGMSKDIHVILVLTHAFHNHND